jgi:large subunit ribosomal protein L15
MDLSTLTPPKGSRKNRKRVGRGEGSGHGGTACKGHKGQKARSGGTTAVGFEGGQMPLKRRLPKRGFANIFKKQYALVDVQQLCAFEAQSVVDPAALVKAGLVTRLYDGIKVLGDGEIDRPLVVKVHKYSQSALKKITAAGGRVEEL